MRKVAFVSAIRCKRVKNENDLEGFAKAGRPFLSFFLSFFILFQYFILLIYGIVLACCFLKIIANSILDNKRSRERKRERKRES